MRRAGVCEKQSIHGKGQAGGSQGAGNVGLGSRKQEQHPKSLGLSISS